MLNLDTHILIFALQGKVRPAERRMLLRSDWGISAIVLWELAKLSQLGRVELDLHSRRFRDALSNVHVWPIDLEVAVASTDLDFYGDPADELIAATSLVHDVPLLTRDRVIRKSRLVPIARV